MTIPYLDGSGATRQATGTHAGSSGDPDLSLETVNTTLTTTVTGVPITGQSLEAGGSGALGWLASIRKAITDRLPAALTGSGNLKVSIAESTAAQAVTGTFWQATQPVSDASGSLTVDSPGLPTALGSTTSSASMPVTLSSDGPFSTLTGALTETAPATDTASSGLNGRLQRIAQRITALIALLPTTLSNGFFQVSVKETITLPASQLGTWTVQPGNTANTTAWKVDGSAVTQPVSVSLPATIYNGKKTVTTAGTRVTLASSQAILSGVTIKALAANTGTIYVGDGSVTSTTGYALAPGDSVFMEIANLATVNLDSSVNGEGVTYIGT